YLHPQSLDYLPQGLRPCVNCAPQCACAHRVRSAPTGEESAPWRRADNPQARVRKQDRKSTRLNSSHVSSSYAVFCLKKKIYIREVNKKKDGNEGFNYFECL